MTKKKLSVFDLDHTLLKVNSSYNFGAYLFRNKVISFFDALYCVLSYASHKFLRTSVVKLHNRIFNRIFLGKKSSYIASLAESFVDENLDSIIYEPTLAALKQAKKDSHYVLILSNSPDFLVKPIAKEFGVDNWQATHYEVDENGKFCSVGNIMVGKQKAKYIEQLMKSEGMEGLTVYSDSYLDLPMLKMADRPVLVNPDRKLAKIGKQWEIIK